MFDKGLTMDKVYGTREIVRNPRLLRIDPNESFTVEDKKAHKKLGIYLGTELAKEFFEYKEKQKLLQSAKKIKTSAKYENTLLEASLDDELQ